MNIATKTAAVIVLGLTAMASAAELTFDDVIKAAEGVKSYQYKETQFLKDRPPVTNQWFFKELGITRIEYSNGSICIDARARNKILLLDPNWKTATILIPMKDRPPYQMETPKTSVLAGRLQGRKKLFGNPENLGKTTIDGRKAVGFQFSQKNVKITLWVDPETKLPFKTEQWGIHDNPFGPSKTEDKRVSFDYVYNPKLDDSLFSLTPPKGYKVEERETMMSGPIEKDFTQGLKACAESNENQFPDELTQTHLMTFVKNSKKRDQVHYMLTFAQMQHQKKHDWRYVGRDVKLGEKDKPVYWYQPEADKPYRVVYGDLSVRDVAKDKLPAIPPTTRPTTRSVIRKRPCCCP